MLILEIILISVLPSFFAASAKAQILIDEGGQQQHTTMPMEHLAERFGKLKDILHETGL